MASITVRDLDEDVKARLRIQAAHKGVSMEAEARRLITEGVQPQSALEAWDACLPPSWQGPEITPPSRKRDRKVPQLSDE